MYPVYALGRSLGGLFSVLAGDRLSLSRAMRRASLPKLVWDRIPQGAFVMVSFYDRQPPPSWMGQRTYLARSENEIPLSRVDEVQYVGNDSIRLGQRRPQAHFHLSTLTMRDFASQLRNAAAGDTQDVYQMVVHRKKAEPRASLTVSRQAVSPQNKGLINDFFSSLSVPGAVYGGISAIPLFFLQGGVVAGVAATVSGIAAWSLGARSARQYPSIGQACRVSAIRALAMDLAVYYSVYGALSFARP